mmetsp:Transcript_18080/g.46317  ORF Transcript_18080/g.46317 Transcript_18080/m.46317 type:complete len:298 (+) Transcript_18080:244-1137(+)
MPSTAIRGAPRAQPCCAMARSPGAPGAARCGSFRPPARFQGMSHPRVGARDVCGAASAGEITREVLTPMERTKLDIDDDRSFYGFPRFVKHVDDGFLGEVTRLYRQRIPEDAAVLDLMSSWVSHLPADKRYARVVGHGMNAQELARNPQLESFFVRNLNEDPDGWAFEDQTFDAVLCCVSVQYMQQPERVFAEIFRVLKPGGVCIITFSNRQFYQKAISAWRDGSGYSRSRLVAQYFGAVAGFTQAEILTEVPEDDGAAEQASPNPLLQAFQRLTSMVASRVQSDPFYAVIAYRCQE